MPAMRPPRRGVSLSEALASAYASAPETEVILETLEFLHPLFTVPRRIVNDHTALTATLEDDAPANPGAEVTFEACYFNLKKPSESDSGRVPELIITVRNVERIFGDLELLKGSLVPIECIYRPYLISDLTAPHISPPLALMVRTATADMNLVSFRASLSSLNNKRFPAKEYTAKQFPSLTAR